MSQMAAFLEYDADGNTHLLIQYICLIYYDGYNTMTRIKKIHLNTLQERKTMVQDTQQSEAPN